MRTLLLIFFCIVLIFSCYGQVNNNLKLNDYELRADSFYTNYNFDSAAIFYNKAADYYLGIGFWSKCIKNFRLTGKSLIKDFKYDSASYFLNKALALANANFSCSNVDHMIEKANILLVKVDMNNFKFEYLKGLQNCNDALSLVENADSTLKQLIIADIYDKMGIIYKNLYKYDSAFYYNQESLNIKTKILSTNNYKISINYFNKANIYLAQRNFDKSLIFFQKAREIFSPDSREMNSFQADCILNIGIVYYYKGNYDEALDFYNNALKMRASLYKDQNYEFVSCYFNIGIVYYEKADYNQAVKYYEKALNILGKLNYNDSKAIYSSLYNCLGLVYKNKYEFVKALDYMKRACNIQTQLLGEINPDVAGSYFNIGLLYIDIGDYDKALEYNQKSLKIRIKLTSEMDNYVSDSFHKIGSIYSSIGDYEKALEYYEKAFRIRKELFGESHLSIAQSFQAIGKIYKIKCDFIKANEMFQKALQIRKFLNAEQYLIANSFDAIGSNYYAMDLLDSALFFFKKAEEIKIKLYGENSTDLEYVYNSLGNIYLKLNEFDSSLYYYNKDLNLSISGYGNLHENVATSFNSLGELYLKMKDYKKALNYFQKALNSNVKDYSDTVIYNNPKLFNILSNEELLKTLTGKGEAFFKLYEMTKLNSDIETSMSSYDLSFQIIDILKSSFNNEDTKFYLSESTKKYYVKALEVQLYNEKIYSKPVNIDKIFKVIEMGKSTILSKLFNEINAKKIAEIPDSLINLEKDCRNNIVLYSNQIFEKLSRKTPIDSIKANELANEKFICSRKLDTLITYFEKSYPLFYSIKNRNQTVTIQQLQQKLNKETALINYFVGDSIVYISIITDSISKILEICVNSNFKNTVLKYVRKIRSIDEDSIIYFNHIIFDYLIKPIQNEISLKKNLIIIPDDYLYYLPFETLISDNESNIKPTDYSKLNYLIKNHTITYHHSATLWYNSAIKGISNYNTYSFLGFAPVFKKEKSSGLILSSNLGAFDSSDYAYRSFSSDLKRINPLPYSREEVLSIFHLFEKNKKEARAYLFEEANETNFKKESGKFNIIHISSHSFSNDKTPSSSCIIFSQPTDSIDKEDGILFANETFNLELNADLVVLSSCESGRGKLIKGEGIQSLSRGFLYTGVPNVVYSLWRVLDNNTKNFMVDFYSNVLKGKTYSESLQQAKLKMIRNKETAFPFFWAGFILDGK
jgi:CHAT domain-containing protein/tetratricopeptide (TPR) repeat protein